MTRHERAVVVSSFDLTRVNGGTLRTLAFSRSLRALGLEVVEVSPGGVQHVPATDRTTTPGRPIGQREWPTWLRNAKRLVSPLPTVSGAFDRELVGRARELSDSALLVAPFPLAYHFIGHPRLWTDFHDLHSRYARREALMDPGFRSVGALAQSKVYRRQEGRLVGASCIVSAAGASDADELMSETRRQVHWLPNPVTGLRECSAPSGERRAGMIADFRYGPNIESTRRLLDEWWPALRTNGWQLVLAGHGSKDIALPPGVEAMGRVESTHGFYAAIDVALAPIQRGGGIKVKVLEALANRRPVIATPFAVEGLREPLPPGVLLADTAAGVTAALRVVQGGIPNIELPHIYSELGFREALSSILGLRN